MCGGGGIGRGKQCTKPETQQMLAAGSRNGKQPQVASATREWVEGRVKDEAEASFYRTS